MAKYTVPRRIMLYCRRGDCEHVFKVSSEALVCEVDGHKLNPANLLAWFSESDGLIQIPEDRIVEY